MSNKLIRIFSAILIIIAGIFVIIGSCTNVLRFYIIAASSIVISGVLTILENISKDKK